jgi:hypothetical protein
MPELELELLELFALPALPAAVLGLTIVEEPTGFVIEKSSWSHALSSSRA